MSGRLLRPPSVPRPPALPGPFGFGIYGGIMRRKLLPGEAADILQVPLVKVVRWAHEGKIPMVMTAEGPRFVEAEIRKWARERGLPPEARRAPRPAAEPARRPFTLSGAVERGGVVFGLPGIDLYEALRNAVDRLPFPPKKRGEILEELLDRESSASTGIGRGVAIPHPRQALDLGLAEPLIPVFYLASPVEFNAIDGRPVRVLFMMFSPSNSVHLDLLSRLGFCLRSEGFLDALLSATAPRQVVELIAESEPKSS